MNNQNKKVLFSKEILPLINNLLYKYLEKLYLIFLFQSHHSKIKE